MKIKFLNNTISILQGERALPYPYYDINYAYKNIIVSNHIRLDKDVDRQLVNEIILKGCIEIASKYYVGLNNQSNPIFDYLVNKINILEDVYEIEENKEVHPFKEEEEIDGK